MILALGVLAFASVRFLVILYNLITWPCLPDYEVKFPLEKELTILIPVRNEEQSLGNLLESIYRLPICHGFIKEIVVLNDHSTDGTYSIFEKYSTKLPLLKWVNGAELPSGWTGKNWACHQVSAYANTKYMLFLDADVILAGNVLSNALTQMRDNELSLLSIFPDQKMVALSEQIIVPLMHYFLLTLLPLRMVKKSKFSSLAAANGQFMLFKTETYKRYLFHEKLKDNVLEDVNIMRAIKKEGYKGEVLLGNGQIYCRMYTSWTEAVSGFSKNFYLGFNKSIIPFMIYFLMVLTGGLIVFLTFNWLLIFIYFTVWIALGIMVGVLSRQHIIQFIALQPFRAIVFMVIALNSVYLHTTNRVTWKGRKITY